MPSVAPTSLTFVSPCWPSSKGICQTNSRPGFNSNSHHGSFSGLFHTTDLKTGTPVATLPGALHNRISTETGQPHVSILRLGETVRATTSISV